ncbi:DsbA family oxidoreductase [Nonomuraea typhae]|uniref:DsbA family oxidoreductase n=1 Tax=Nonomuraea typhae TaxID=2603600 RepID=A0ABW7Z1G2_9ACTN
MPPRPSTRRSVYPPITRSVPFIAGDRLARSRNFRTPGSPRLPPGNGLTLKCILLHIARTFYYQSMQNDNITIKVELFSDMICPFCHIGKTLLDQALDQFDQRDQVEVSYRSFQLDPSAARVAGETLPEREMRFHGLSRAAVRQRLGTVTAMAEAAGLAYDLDRALPVRTFDAHRLTHFAAEYGKAGELSGRLLQAYTSEGRSLADHDTLVELAAATGLDAGQAREVLASGRYADAVRADVARAARLGVGGVPTLVIDGYQGISAIESPEVLVEMFRKALARAGERACAEPR